MGRQQHPHHIDGVDSVKLDFMYWWDCFGNIDNMAIEVYLPFCFCTCTHTLRCCTARSRRMLKAILPTHAQHGLTPSCTAPQLPPACQSRPVCVVCRKKIVKLTVVVGWSIAYTVRRGQRGERKL